MYFVFSATSVLYVCLSSPSSQNPRKAGVWYSSQMRHLQTMLLIFADKSCIFADNVISDHNYVKKWILAGALYSEVSACLLFPLYYLQYLHSNTLYRHSLCYYLLDVLYTPCIIRSTYTLYNIHPLFNLFSAPVLPVHPVLSYH